jgi:hypothetical protein
MLTAMQPHDDAVCVQLDALRRVEQQVCENIHGQH